MEKLGYVRTARNERDARQSLAQLTDGGRELLSDADGILADQYRAIDLRRTDTTDLESLLARIRSS